MSMPGMRFSRALIHTLRETPADAEVVSHQLMLRAGYIRQVARGVYTYLPLGWRVLQKIMGIVRDELNRAGCEEVQMPCLIPAELWQQSGRWQQYGKELLRMKDRHNREFCFGPTHEEVITTTMAAAVRSYKELPKHLYQIHTKFRDEIRPRFGLMRGREFLMKDSYSFHATREDLDVEYDKMRDVYQRIFARCGLPSRVVEAATGNIGGSSSHEVMVLADTGESAIAHCACGYAANVELAAVRSTPLQGSSTVTSAAWQAVHTPNVSTVEDVAALLRCTPARMIKTLVFLRDGGVVVALLPGDAQLNEAKLQAATGAEFLAMADAATVRALTGAAVGFAGPVGLPAEVADVGAVRVVADPAVMAMGSGNTGANKTDYHLVGVVPGRDFTPDQVADLRCAQAGDGCPRCADGVLAIMRGIEVGHIFKLGTKYAEPLGARFLDREGKEQTTIMGTYGLGIGRTAAAAIEQNHDEHGIRWPLPIAPYQVALLLLNNKQDAHVAYADAVYQQLCEAGVEVLYDDRNERAGVKFADAELIGIPYFVIIGGKGIEQHKVEFKPRGGEGTFCTIPEVVNAIQQALRTASGCST